MATQPKWLPARPAPFLFVAVNNLVGEPRAAWGR
jgi:hypothetical protein